MPRHTQTIAALSSGQGRSGVAVIRVSGPAVASVAAALVGGLPPARVAGLRTLREPGSGAVLDSGLVLYFPAPNSFTGEDVLELQVHGSPAVTRRLLALLAAMDDVRLAEPGEFTRRAFENGKLDLLAAEDLALLIDSETELQRRVAIDGREGRFRRHVTHWRDAMLALQALVEAQIDFSDEADIPPQLGQELAQRLGALRQEIATALDTHIASERIRDGYRVVLAGPPNAGKSSLLNALAGREAAIVSPQAGTTRDVIEIRLDLGGVPVLLQDVAGLRATADAIERIGVARAEATMAAADLVLWLMPADAPAGVAPPGALPLRSKSDLMPGDGGHGDSLAVSAQTGTGLEELLAQLQARAAALLTPREATFVLNLRQEACLRQGLRHLGGAVLHLDGEIEFLAEDLRRAANEMRALLGDVGIEEVLGHIFARFCIGK